MRYFYLFTWLVALAVGVVSCKTSDAQYTPYISVSSFLRGPKLHNDTIIGCRDTVKIAYDQNLGCYQLDTIQVGDTVVFMVGFGSRGNRLLSASIAADTTNMMFRCAPSEDFVKILKDSTSVSNMQFDFTGDHNFASLRVYYTPLKLGTHKMVFTVRSDSKFSPVSMTFMQNVYDKK